MTASANNHPDDPTEAIELAEIKRLARQRCLDILRGDGPIRASMLGTILKLLEQTGSLEPKPPEPPESTLERALRETKRLPFPGENEEASAASAAERVLNTRRKPLGCNEAGE